MKRIAEGESSSEPKSILKDRKLIRNPAKIAKTMDDLFHQKIKDIRDNIPETNEDPIELVSKQIPRTENNSN